MYKVRHKTLQRWPLGFTVKTRHKPYSPSSSHCTPLGVSVYRYINTRKSKWEDGIVVRRILERWEKSEYSTPSFVLGLVSFRTVLRSGLCVSAYGDRSKWSENVSFRTFTRGRYRERSERHRSSPIKPHDDRQWVSAHLPLASRNATRMY
jgi:hypothetical protein